MSMAISVERIKSGTEGLPMSRDHRHLKSVLMEQQETEVLGAQQRRLMRGVEPRKLARGR